MSNEAEIRTVGVIGLGLMGSAMSKRLLEAGYGVVGYDIESSKCDALTNRGGESVTSPQAVAERAQFIVASLPNAAASTAAFFGDEGVTRVRSSNAIVADTTTMKPSQATEIADAFKESTFHYADVGISGNALVVQNGEALAIVGCEGALVSIVEGVLTSFCNRVMHVGAAGDAMKAKLIMNHIITVNRWVMAEALVFAERLGLQLSELIPVLESSLAGSRVMDTWARGMVERRFTPPRSQIKTHNKDAQMILELGREVGMPMPALAASNVISQVAIAKGLAEAENAVIIEVVRDLAGSGDIKALLEEIGLAGR